MLLVLASTGLFVYLRFRAELNRTIDLNLHTQAAALLPLIERSDAGLGGAVQSLDLRAIASFESAIGALGAAARIQASIQRQEQKSVAIH